MKFSREYRAMAREQLGGQIFANRWLYALIAFVVVSALEAFFVGTVIVPLLIEGFLSVGLCTIFLKLARGADDIRLEDLFCAKDNIGNAILLGLMKNVFIFLWSLLFVIPGIVKTYSYSMAYYLRADHPEYEWDRCLKESARMMKGHKWALFCLDLSFLGWYLLGTLAFGIGILFVLPYREAAVANFYEDLDHEPIVL